MEMCTNPREGEYLNYLADHIYNVRRSWEQFLSPVVMEAYPEEWIACNQAILEHDDSKYEYDEFNPYCDYFYPAEDHPKDQKSFDRAWLLHQHRNPHHWQYWVLVRDEGELVPMDMPIAEIVSMCCDWHSFSAKNPDSTAAVWYEQNKDKMIMSDFTSELVAFFLQYLTEPLAR